MTDDEANTNARPHRGKVAATTCLCMDQNKKERLESLTGMYGDGTTLVLSELGTWEFWDSTEVGTGMMVRRPSSYLNR
jgi:hypothetical protein